MSVSYQPGATHSQRRGEGTHSRSASGRARDYERPTVRENGSPVLALAELENGVAGTGSKVSHPVERYKEKQTITTIKTVTKRSPIKYGWISTSTSTSTGKASLNKRWKSVQSPVVSKTSPEAAPAPAPAPKPRIWNPTTSLKAHSSAPLASRIPAPPISQHAPQELLLFSLAEMSLQEQERAMIDDLLFVFMGYEGQYVRFSDSYNPSEEKDRLVGPSYRPPHGLDPSLRDLTNSMLQMASHYSALEAFVEVQSRAEYGSVNHALCAAMRKLLKDYLILVAQLESKVIDDDDADAAFTLHRMQLAVIPTLQSLSQLYAVAQELLRKNALLEEDVDESIDDFNADNIIERLREGGDLLPGSMSKKRCIGGNVLALLTERLATFSGDPAARSIIAMLLREASAPYVKMLNEWLHHGGISDPHAEFLVGERTSIKRERLDEDYTDEYWDKRYYVREKEVPPQLAAVKDRVLLAGKYLNVVRECGGVNITASIDNTPASFEDPGFLDNVNNAYAFANNELLKLLLAKSSLRGRLRSMKHYFFLDRAEFFLYFLELSNSELRKPQRNVNVGKLQSLLDLVLYQPGSIAVADPYKEDVKVQMNEVGLTQWLMKIVTVQGMDQDNLDSMIEQYKAPPSTSAASSKDDDKDIVGFDALELDYAVPFPLSLIVSRKTVLRYQLIFRYTLALRHLEMSLIDSWSEHNKAISWTHKSSNKRLEMWKRRAWNLRSRMLVFVQQMLFYATAEVIEPNWQKLMAKVDAAEAFQRGEEDELPLHRKAGRTVDELMQDHLDMLDSCMKDLGLTQGKLLRIHAKLMTGCTMFANYTANLTRNLYAADADFDFLSTEPDSKKAEKVKANFRQFSTSSIPEQDPNRMQRIEDTLARHEEYFNRHLKILIDSLNYFAATETVVLLGLCARLTNAEVQKRDDMGL